MTAPLLAGAHAPVTTVTPAPAPTAPPTSGATVRPLRSTSVPAAPPRPPRRGRGDPPVAPRDVTDPTAARVPQHAVRGRPLGRPTTPVPLPDPTALCCAVVRAAVEVVRGERTVGQLARWVSPEIYEALARRARLVADGPGETPARPVAVRRARGPAPRGRRRRGDGRRPGRGPGPRRRGAPGGAPRSLARGRARDRLSPSRTGHDDALPGPDSPDGLPWPGATTARRPPAGGRLAVVVRAPGGRAPGQASFWPWQTLYFLPEPHGHCALRGVPGKVRPSLSTAAASPCSARRERRPASPDTTA